MTRTRARRANRQKANAMLALSGVGISFGGVKALSDIDLEVKDGEVRAVAS